MSRSRLGVDGLVWAFAFGVGGFAVYRFGGELLAKKQASTPAPAPSSTTPASPSSSTTPASPSSSTTPPPVTTGGTPPPPVPVRSIVAGEPVYTTMPVRPAVIYPDYAPVVLRAGDMVAPAPVAPDLSAFLGSQAGIWSGPPVFSNMATGRDV